VPGEGPKKRVAVFVIASEPLLKAYLYCLLLSLIRPSIDSAEDKEMKEIKALLKEKHQNLRRITNIVVELLSKN
jgi:hypothetical protein